jgi:hypothetical protein
MSAKNATTGCVDPDLKIKGAKGVRIIDGSIFVSLMNGALINIYSRYS